MKQSQQCGYILVPAIFMLALLALLAYQLNADSVANLNLGKQQTETQRARYIAEAGLAHAEWLANHNACTGYNMASTPFQAGSYSATFVPNSGSPVSIAAAGILANGAMRSMTRDNMKVYDMATVKTEVFQLEPNEGKDTFIEGQFGHKDHNKGDKKDLKTNSQDGKEYRTLLQFDLTGLPAAATVQSATLELYLQSFGSTDTVKAHRLLRDWAEDEATWEDYDDDNSWDTPGGDYDSTVAGSFLANGIGLKTMNITAVAQQWVSGAQPNYGLLLLSDPSPSGSQNKYHSSDKAGEPHPKLTLKYYCECGTSCASTPAPSCEADYTPMFETRTFSSGGLGAEDVQAITFVPEGTVFDGVSAPADGAWILIDPFDQLFYMTDMAGAELATLNLPRSDINGGVYVSSGDHADELALTTTSGSVAFVNMQGNIESTLSTSAFGVSQPVGIGFVRASSSRTFEGHLLVLDGSNETVTVINQAGTQVATINVDDGQAPVAQDVKHLPGSDKLIVTYDCCKNAIYDFSGTKLREYDLAGFGATVSQASAIQPLSCEHVVAEGGADRLMYLSADARPYVETFQTWEAIHDGSWESKDLGDIGVPPGAVAEVAVVNTNANRQREGGVRARGSSLERLVDLHETQDGSADVVVMHVQADASANIEYYSANTDDVTFILLGYWTSGTYEESWEVFNADASGSWRDLSLGGDVSPGQVAEIVMTNRNEAAEREAGVRTLGSAAERRFVLNNAEGGGVDANTLLVNAGTDANATIEVFAESDFDVQFHLAGYWSTPPGNYTESAGASREATDADTWLHDASGVPAGAVASVTLVNKSATLANTMGMRETGSALLRILPFQDTQGAGAELATFHANTDTSAEMQWYSEAAGSDHSFHISGWWVLP